MAEILRRAAALGMAVLLIGGGCVCAEPSKQVDTAVSTQLVKAKSGILMEAETQEVLYEWNADEKLQIASVTKVMTMLLIMEAIEDGKIRWEDRVTTSEKAASMGGSQVFLEVGEQMTVEDMLKAIAVASGNDAAVAMAEHISGTEEAFVEKMNQRAAELGCDQTHFINCNGLNETKEHYSTARDLARISQELLKHREIFRFTTIWMDSLRNGQFGLSNTNKLIRFYEGANGLKTGSTDIAKYCLAATAERDGMQLIAVVLCAPTTAERFESATALLDYGFANYALADSEKLGMVMPDIAVQGGAEMSVRPQTDAIRFVVKKGNQDRIEWRIEAEEVVKAPIREGDVLGKAVFMLEGEEVAVRELKADKDVLRITYLQMLMRMAQRYVSL